ncbi:MAG: regulator [Candidatus Hydrogenedens sp.]|nr:regulator [Candidatus Hydrogenedentota bacterium]NLF57467.1 regulator [Candidatus Hydrogenedens sp.]
MTLTLLLAFAHLVHGAPPVQDTPFVQEYREFHPLPGGANDVRGLAFDGEGVLWAATAEGVFLLSEGVWRAAHDAESAGPCFTAAASPTGGVWVGAWNGVWRCSGGKAERMGGLAEPVSALAFDGASALAFGPRGNWRFDGKDWTAFGGKWATSSRDTARDSTGGLWLSTAHGLYLLEGERIARHLHKEEDLLTGDQLSVTVGPDGLVWAGGYGGIDVYRGEKRVRSFSPREGLANLEVRRLRFHPDGTLWVCTGLGVTRWNGSSWSLRHSLRWLPSDDTRDVAFDRDGAAWVATAEGVGVIRRRMTTLAEKAAHYYDICMARKVREPWIVGDSRLMVPGDVTSNQHEDDDNDGEYTNLYMAMEAFRYQVTGDPDALDRARKAFDTMERFQTITGTDGFIARTMVPVEWAGPDNPNPSRLHDANRTHTAREEAQMLVDNPRHKTVEERWRPSADGKWLWKGDTSSDEMSGHFFGYYIYYKYVAQTDAEREKVARLTARVMDYLMAGGYTLLDTDGTHTLWGVWAPERLHGDGNWRAERPVNATELLSYLKTAHVITGEERFDRAYRELISRHGYLELARAPKPTAPSERTDIDSDLLVLALPALLMEEHDPEFRAAYEQGLRQWFGQVGAANSPFFNFMCGALGVEDFNLEECVKFLRDCPLDIIHWTVDNRARQDLRLVRYPELYGWQTDRLPPADERPVMRWDKNPYDAVRGDGGRSESSGVFWLLPYWMGRHFGFIAPPDAGN